jgi:putative transposase
MNRVLRYRLYPTSQQADALSEMLQEHCTLYNAALQERRDAWKIATVSIKYTAQSAQLSQIQRDVPDQCRDRP